MLPSRGRFHPLSFTITYSSNTGLILIFMLVTPQIINTVGTRKFWIFSDIYYMNIQRHLSQAPKLSLTLKQKGLYSNSERQLRILNTVFRSTWDQVGTRFLLSITGKQSRSSVPCASSAATLMPRQNVQVALSRRVVCWGALKDNVTVETVQHNQVSAVKSWRVEKKIKWAFFFCVKADNWR